MRKRRLQISWQLGSGGGLVLLLAAATALADGESQADPAVAPMPCETTAARPGIDWPALLVGSFDVQGPPESAGRENAENLDERRPEQNARAGLIRERSMSPQGTGTEEGFRMDRTARRQAAGTSVQQDSAASPRPVGTAAEILKLRRAVGLNPIAGEIFDAASAQGTTRAGEPSASITTAERSDEEAIAEIVERLESERSMADCAQAECETWRGPIASGGSDVSLLRPAERKLEEAADLLEQLGQYDRADIARDLARQIREQARQLERHANEPIGYRSAP
jgi:hypothetical protein